jgi:hypothetical protein
MKLLLLSFAALAWLYVEAVQDRNLAEAQRDEAFDLARQHQESSRYWFNATIQTAAHFAVRENSNP